MSGQQKKLRGSDNKELRQFASQFLAAFANAAKNTRRVGTRRVTNSLSYQFGIFVELDDATIEARRTFVHWAAKFLQTATAHETVIAQIALSKAHEFVARNSSIEIAVADLIGTVLAQSDATFEYLAPNALFRLDATCTELTVGRVSIKRPDQFADSLGPVIWCVSVNAIAENVEEEAKWWIDVATSYLRLSHSNWSRNVPLIGKVEPFPWTVTSNAGLKIREGRVVPDARSESYWYAIDSDVVATTRSESFIKQASLVFNPLKGSLAERVSQGLAWLSRSRQSKDRAERFLFAFTAIEALLTRSDKTAPVTQTIARHAAVLITDENTLRSQVASDLLDLYESRSKLVHAGNRSIYWSTVVQAEDLAEFMYRVVLEYADLGITHESFCEQLREASYGTVWPAQKMENENKAGS